MRASWEALHAGLDRSARSLRSEQAFQQVKQTHPVFARFDEPQHLIAHLTSKAGDLDEKDRILGTLVMLVQQREHHDLASALLWLALWPALDALYRRRQRHFRGQSDELISELASAFTSLIDRLDLGSVKRVAATLVRSTERDVMERRKRIWREPLRFDDPLVLIDLIDQAEWLSPQSETTLSFHEVCSWLQPIVGTDAELLLAVLVLDETQREAGSRLGLSADASRKRFQRALARIRGNFAPSVSPADRAGWVCSSTNPLHWSEEPTDRRAVDRLRKGLKNSLSRFVRADRVSYPGAA
jgi:RNA polymerase sigma-70 factor (ECF subfamily)